jgi:hypothetical protein
MRNVVSSFKQYRPRRAVSRIGVLLMLGGAAAAISGPRWLPPAALAAGRQAPEAARLRLPGRPSPELARLFVPPHAPAGAYEVLVMEGAVAEARKAVWKMLNPGLPADQARDAWREQELEPLEAFGEAGTYPRTRVARLYTGRRASVVRAPIVRDGRTVAAITLISPYPDPTLSRLEEGTMAIVLHLQPGSSRQAANSWQ